MKNKITAALLSLVLGVFGVQFFYLGRIGLGMFMCMLTFFAGKPQIAAFVGFINFIILLTKSDNDFNRKYNKDLWREQQNQNNQSDFTIREQREQREQQKEQQRAEQQAAQQNREARARMRPTAPPQYQKPEKSSVSQKENLKQSALAKFKDFDYQGATEDFGKALAIDPADVAVHWNLSCCYSLTEQKELAFYHLQKATELGFKDYDKIKTHEALAFLRVQPEFETFARNGFRMTEDMEHSEILQQLKDLTKRREGGLLSEKEFADMSRKLYE